MFWTLPLAGALGGALLNRKNPLDGALIGGAAGGLGALAAPSIAASFGAAAPVAAQTAAQAAPAAASVATEASAQPSMFGQAMGALDKYSKPIGVAANVAQVGQGRLSQPQMQAPQLQPRPGVDMSGLLSPQDWQQKSLARKQQQMAQMGLLGGGYGRIG